MENKRRHHAFSIGADAIQVATRFVTTVECDADPAYKNAYLHAEKSDIVFTKKSGGNAGTSDPKLVSEADRSRS